MIIIARNSDKTNKIQPILAAARKSRYCNVAPQFQFGVIPRSHSPYIELTPTKTQQPGFVKKWPVEKFSTGHKGSHCTWR